MSSNITILCKKCSCGTEFTVEQIIRYNNDVANDSDHLAGIKHALPLMKIARPNDKISEFSDIRLCCLLTLSYVGYGYEDSVSRDNNIVKYSAESIVKVASRVEHDKYNILGGTKISSQKDVEVPQSGTPGVTIVGFKKDNSGKPLTIPCGNVQLRVLDIKTDYDSTM